MNKFLPSEEFHGNGDEETAKKEFNNSYFWKCFKNPMIFIYYSIDMSKRTNCFELLFSSIYSISLCCRALKFLFEFIKFIKSYRLMQFRLFEFKWKPNITPANL